MPNFKRLDQSILTLATAGLTLDQIADIRNPHYPRVDYVELQNLIDMDVINYSVYDQNKLGSLLRYLETQLRSDLYLTLLGLLNRQSYQLVFAMSERAGIPFAGLQHVLPCRKPLVSMFTSWSWRQESVIKNLNLFSAMDLIIVKCQALKNHFIKLNAPPERIRVIPFGIDHQFFAPLVDVEQQNKLVMTVGEIRTRDYSTLFQAIDGLSIKLLAAASGSWYAREKNTNLQAPFPENVVITGRFTLAELRVLYAQSLFVVLPVYNVPFSAGATSLLEAMSMGRAVIVTRSQGILDYVMDGQTGITVTPGNVAEMREAISYLLARPDEARRLGRNARQRIEELLNLDVYVEKIAETLRDFASRL